MNAADGRAMLAFLRQSMAQANDIDNNSNDDDGPDILTKLQTNDLKLKRLVIGPQVETLTFVLQKESKPDKYLPKSSDEWVKVGEYIGAHEHIEYLELYFLNHEGSNESHLILKTS